MLLKGLTAPIQAWQVLGERATEVRFDVRQMSGTTPLVGRSEELALILRRWEQVKEGKGQVVLLFGRARHRQEPARASRCANASLGNRTPWSATSARPITPTLPSIRSSNRSGALPGFDEADDADSKIDKLEASLRIAFDDVSDVAPLFAALLSINAGDRYAVSHLRPEALKEATLEGARQSVLRDCPPSNPCS